MTTQIRQYREQIARLNVETQGIQLGTVIIPLQTATEKLAGEFSDAFMSIIDGTKSVGEAFRNLAYNVCKYILQMILQEAAWKLTSGLLKSFGLGGGNVKTGGSTTGGTTGGGITGGGLPAAATGGLIDGPGTGTSDSILARVSKGEFVVKAASVSTYGEEFMHRLNRGLIMPNTLPKFADGGLVSTSNTGSASFFQANGAEKSIVTSSTGTKSGPAIIMNIQTPNAESFRQSRGQITADMTRALIQGRRNM
jgi:hypothetical protein